MKRSLVRLIIGIPACLLVAVVIACGAPEKHQGAYFSEGDQRVPAMSIELQEGGKGVWKKGNEKFSFNWGMKGEELRLHLKDGGVLVGHVRNGGLEISLPGAGQIVFSKK